jgi:hypothetical protein
MAPGSASLTGELRCCHMSHGPDSLWTRRIKKDLAALGTQLGLRVSKIRSHVTEVLARRVDRQCHHYLQDLWIGLYNAAQQCSIARLSTHRHGWQGM